MRYTYEKDYVSRRSDGRTTASLASFTEYLRRRTPLLALPEDLDADKFSAWKAEVRRTVTRLLALPPETSEPSPICLSSEQRQGYRTEKWEFYPYETAAVPVLLQIPDGASAASPAPIVFCFPGSIHNKEFVAGEPLLDHPAARFEKFPERNRIGQYMAENGMVSVVFDPISIGETSFVTDPGDYGGYCRGELCYGLLEYGWNYVGLSVFQAMCFMRFAKTLPYVDASRVGLAAHSLGTETALMIALLSDDVKALVFNDFLSDPGARYVAVTETDGAFADKGGGMQHILPGMFRYFGFSDLAAALSPMPLALNEGGAEEDLDKVRRAYALCGAADNLRITYYPRYAEKENRKHDNDRMPRYGLSEAAYFDYTATDAPDHSFRKEPSLALFRRVFGLREAK